MKTYQIVLWNSSGDALDRRPFILEDGADPKTRFKQELIELINDEWFYPGDSVTFEEYK